MFQAICSQVLNFIWSRQNPLLKPHAAELVGCSHSVLPVSLGYIEPNLCELRVNSSSCVGELLSSAHNPLGRFLWTASLPKRVNHVEMCSVGSLSSRILLSVQTVPISSFSRTSKTKSGCSAEVQSLAAVFGLRISLIEPIPDVECVLILSFLEVRSANTE